MAVTFRFERRCEGKEVGWDQTPELRDMVGWRCNAVLRCYATRWGYG